MQQGITVEEPSRSSANAQARAATGAVVSSMVRPFNSWSTHRLGGGGFEVLTDDRRGATPLVCSYIRMAAWDMVSSRVKSFNNLHTARKEKDLGCWPAARDERRGAIALICSYSWVAAWAVVSSRVSPFDSQSTHSQGGGASGGLGSLHTGKNWGADLQPGTTVEAPWRSFVHTRGWLHGRWCH